MWRDRGLSRSLIERAREAGYHALVLTVDVPVAGRRLRDLHNGFTVPPALKARTILDTAATRRGSTACSAGAWPGA